MESSGSSEDAVLAIAAGQERMAQQAMAAMLSAQPVVTMIARGWRSAKVSNHDMITTIAKNPDKASPLNEGLRRQRMLGGCTEGFPRP